MKYSVPYMIGYTCVAYNKEKLGEIENSWNIFGNEALKGRMTLLNDLRETIGAALFFQGKSMNTTDDASLEAAKQQVIKWKKNLAKFDNEVYKVGIQSGEFLVVQGYSGDLFQVLDETRPLIYVPQGRNIHELRRLGHPLNRKEQGFGLRFYKLCVRPEKRG